MKRIFARSILREFWELHPDTEQYLRNWYDMVIRSNWKNPMDVRRSCATASILKNCRVVFNIKGQSYRLVSEINYEKQFIFIRFIGTHAEYDKVDANTIS